MWYPQRAPVTSVSIEFAMTIYLDNAAGTPIAPLVLEAMLPWLKGSGANAGSHHALGRIAAQAVSTARSQVASLLGRDVGELTFTASATEACNLAVKGMVRPLLQRGKRVHLLAPLHEHLAVLDPIRRLEREGAHITLFKPAHTGWVQAQDIIPHLQSDTVLVACMHANNEVGTVNDIASVQEACRNHGAKLLVDASQSAGRIDVASLDVDLLVASSHKLHGPAGAGVLGVRGGGRNAALQPQIEGGGQESGIRSGSVNVPSIVGFGAACAMCAGDMDDEATRVAALRDTLEQGLLGMFPGSHINGDVLNRLPFMSNLTLATGLPDPLHVLVPDVAFSAGSTCAGATPGPSHVLEAMGLSANEAAGSIRLSLGRQTQAADIDAAIEAFRRISR
jgi:cysteine desulfurase